MKNNVSLMPLAAENDPENRDIPMDDQFPDGMFRFEKRIKE